MQLLTGQLTLTGSAQPLSPTRVEAEYILIRALDTNTGLAYIGPSGVTTGTGFPRAAGDEFEAVNSNRPGEAEYDLHPHSIYAVGTPGDKVAWLAWAW